MYPPARIAFERLIDYAGMFPPAKLSLEQSLANYLACRRSPDAWMLGKFICPAGRLAEAAALIRDGDRAEAPVEISLIVPAADTAAGGIDSVSQAARIPPDDAEVRVESLEMRLPEELVVAGDVRGMREFITAGLDRTEAAFQRRMPLFVEAPAVHGADAALSVIDALAGVATGGAADGPPAAAFKLRAGGVTADAFPSTDEVKSVIVATARAGVAMKATAGLHHAIAAHDEEIGVWRHGFVNLLAASALARQNETSGDEIAAALTLSEPAAVAFSDEGLKLAGISIPAQALAAARTGGFLSFGSCSIDEPAKDIRRLIGQNDSAAT